MKHARKGTWVWVKEFGPADKAAVAEACQRLIADRLKPRFLPEIRPTKFNYPIDIVGRWRGNKYSFIARFRSGFADNAGLEFDSAFARLDHIVECHAETRFDVMWHRHTGQWFRLHPSVNLGEALHLVETDPVLRPPI